MLANLNGMIPPDVRTESTLYTRSVDMGTSLFDSTIEYNGKIENVGALIKAFGETLIEVMKGTKEALDEGRPVTINNGCIKPAVEPEPAQAEEAKQEPETVTIRKSDWDQLLKLAQLFRTHQEAPTDYKISVGADAAGTVIYINDHLVQ